MPDTTTAYDWRGHARERGIHPVTAWLTVRDHWPLNNQFERPLNTRQLDQLLTAHPEHAGFVAGCIDDINRGTPMSLDPDTGGQ